MRLALTPVAACIAALALAAPASGQGTGANITPVEQIEFEARHQSVKNAGTDLEFATIRGKDYAFVGSYNNGLQIIDISKPEDPERVAVWDCGLSQGDVQVFRRDDLGGGPRWFATFTKDGSYAFRPGSQCAQDIVARNPDFKFPGTGTNAANGTFIVELTNPKQPETVSFFAASQGSHNGTVHPSGKWFYNSNSDLITSPLPAIEVYSLEDPFAPRFVRELPLKTFPGLGTESHDITFNAAGTRAYTAALSHAEILDTTRPEHPISIGTILDPAINVWHQSDPVRIKDPILGTRDFLVVEDEVAGATGTGQCPNGGVHVYDITGDLEKAPVKVGYWNIDDARTTSDETLGTCTAHVFDIHEDEALMTISYYNGGVRVVDLSGLVGVALGTTGVGMKQLGFHRFPNSDSWAVKAPTADRKGFFLYSADQKRGFDAYRYAPAAPVAAGRWMTPGEQMLAARNQEAKTGKPALAAVCLFGQEGVRAAATQAGLSTSLIDAR